MLRKYINCTLEYASYFVANFGGISDVFCGTLWRKQYDSLNFVMIWTSMTGLMRRMSSSKMKKKKNQSAVTLE